MTKKSITAYSLYDFAVAFQDAVVEGYQLDTRNENFPVQYGPNIFACTLLKKDVESVPQVDDVEQAPKEEDQPKAEEQKPRPNRMLRKPQR